MNNVITVIVMKLNNRDCISIILENNGQQPIYITKVVTEEQLVHYDQLAAMHFIASKV